MTPYDDADLYVVDAVNFDEYDCSAAADHGCFADYDRSVGYDYSVDCDYSAGYYSVLDCGYSVGYDYFANCDYYSVGYGCSAG